MKRAYLLPFTLGSGALLITPLSACGGRTSLPAPDTDPTCQPWSVHDGAPGVRRSVESAVVLPRDGGVVLAMHDLIQDGAQAPSSVYGIRKLDPDGRIAWDVTLDDAGWIHGLARDAAGWIFAGGALWKGEHTVLGTKLTCSGQDVCGLILKLDEAGTVQWAKVLSSDATTGGILMNAPAVTADGRVAVEGWFHGTLDLGCGALTETEGDDMSRFVAELSPWGECLWSRAIVSPKLPGWAPDRIVVDDAGEVALILTLPSLPGAHSIDLGGGPVSFDTENGRVLAVAKYAPEGDLVFAKVVTGSSADPSAVLGVPHVALTGTGEVILSAVYEGALDLGGGVKGSPGLVRQFVTRLSAKGDELWTRDIAVGLLAEVGQVPGPFSLTLDPDEDILLAYPSVPGMKVLDEPTSKDALYVVTYEAGGDVASTQAFPRTGTVSAPLLDASERGALFLAGFFAGTVDFGPTPLVSEGTLDAFVVRSCR